MDQLGPGVDCRADRFIGWGRHEASIWLAANEFNMAKSGLCPGRPFLTGPGPGGSAPGGALIQGGLLIGSGAEGAEIWQDNEGVRVSESGGLLGFGRDAPATWSLKIVYADRTEEFRTPRTAKRGYRIQRIDGLPRRKLTPRSRKDLERIRDDVVELKKARAGDDAGEDFPSGFMWPVQGPVSDVYGSQRVLNGTARWTRFGVDIARPTGTPVVAPADGVITLAHPDMFFSGGTLLTDHGHKLSFAFLHLSRISVELGQAVKKANGPGRLVQLAGSPAPIWTGA